MDWCGINLWRQSHFTGQRFRNFKTFCDEKKKPMFLPETSNQSGTGARNDSDWNDYFVPFFDLIARENIKAFIHINWDWPSTGFGISFADDNRLQSNDYIWQQYQAKIGGPRYITVKDGIFTDPVNHAPRAEISVADDDHTVASVPGTMNWAGNASTDADSDPLACSWDFGDGQTGTGCDLNHVYDDAGTYLVRLGVSDGRGGRGSAMSFVVVGTPPQEDVGIHATSSQPLPRNSIQVTVNGNTADAPVTVNAAVGSFVNVDAPTPQPAAQPRNEFRDWATGGSRTKQLLVAPASLRHRRAHTAHFVYVP